jgi:alpha-galactosidase
LPKWWEGPSEMPAKAKKNETALELAGDKLVLRLEKNEGAIYISRVDGKIKFGPILCFAGFKPSATEKKFILSTVVKPGEPEITKSASTPIGKATLISWPFTVDGCGLIWEIASFDNEEFAAFRVRIINHGKETGYVDELSPFAYRGAGDGLEMGAGYTLWRFYRLGYQSWSPAGSINFQQSQPYGRNFLARTIALAPRLWKERTEWIWSSEYMAQIVEPEIDLSFLLGFITAKDQTGTIETELKYDRFRRYQAVCDCEGIPLEPGQELASEWAVAIAGDAPRANQKKYLDLLAEAMQARKTRPVTGWNSWYYYLDKIDEPALLKNLEKVDRLNPKPGLFQLDDGYQNAVGDWLDWNPKFPSGPVDLVNKVHNKGLKAGIWLAPFNAAASSRLFLDHPDWILQNPSGRPALAMVNPAWKGYLAYALDATNPAVQDWLKATVEKLVREYMFDFLKLDFLYSAALPGKRYDPKMTGAQALRKGLEIIREAAGDKCYILGCGAPLGPAVGLVDGMRVSQDTKRGWSNWMDMVFGLEISPSLKSCLKNNFSRSLTANRLWALDPDCLLLSGAGKLNEQEIQSQLAACYLLGGQALVSEDLSMLSDDQFRRFSLATPVAERPAEPIDLFERDTPEQMFISGEKMNILALFNSGKEQKPCRVNLFRFGLKGRFHIFDFFRKEYLGEFEGKFDLGKVPAHGVRYLALAPVADEPQVVGLDFHLGMGISGVELAKGKGGKLTLKIALPGKRKGTVWIKIPGQKELQKQEAVFENKLETQL